MARSLPLSRSARKWLNPSPTPTPKMALSRMVAFRAQSNGNRIGHADLVEIETLSSSSDPLLRKLEDAIHQIIVQRAAPDWLPFLPGTSYWVPPRRSQTHGIAQLVDKLANPPNSEEILCTTNSRGWPSSDFFVKGELMEVKTTSNGTSKLEDEED